jgi:hypothetical protein
MANLGNNSSGGSDPGFDLLAILNSARKAVPAVDFAFGVTGLAAAGAIILAITGNGRAALVVVTLVFVGMILLFAFAGLVAAGQRVALIAGTVLIWVVIVFFAVFLVFTVTAFAFGQPCYWSAYLGLRTDCGDLPPPPPTPSSSSEVSSSAPPPTSSSELPYRELVVKGDTGEASSGGPQAPNPGCQGGTAQICVTPQNGGQLLVGSGTLYNEKSYGRTNWSVSYNTSAMICIRLEANTTACETKHWISGTAAAVEKYPLAP